MKPLRYLILHCTASPEGRNITAADIIRWHTSPPPLGRGWSRVGYSDLIMLDGSLINLRDYNQNDQVENDEYTFGVIGKNEVSRHIVYAGGCDARMSPMDTRTPDQIAAMTDYIRFMVRRHPAILIAGHYHFARKACPSFHVEEWLTSIGIPDSNIFRGRE